MEVVGSSPTAPTTFLHFAEGHASNQISGLSYDASGNTLSDGTYSYTWDGESQMKTAAGVTYAYDGDGRRAAKVGTKLYWYGSGGEILSETDAAGNTLNEYVFFGGKRVAVVPASGSALYYAEDLLGSSRVIVQSNGTLCYDADFTPFGGEKSYTSTCPQNYKFEGKERDTETGNDDFGARYYSNRFGRWLSSDWSAVPVAVPYANLSNPQTLNLYSMVADDPESFADLDGHTGMGNTTSGSCGNVSSGAIACTGDVGGGRLKEFILDGLSEGDAPTVLAQLNTGSMQGAQALAIYFASWAQQQTANAAASQEGSMKYAVNGTTVAANGTVYHKGDKCNEFVCDAGQAGTGHRAQVPYSGLEGKILSLFGIMRDPSTKEWATIAIPGYSGPLPLSAARPGDVIAMAHHDDADGHVGIYVGNGMTASANAYQGGRITVNNWGFRGPGQNGEHPGDAGPVVRQWIGLP